MKPWDETSDQICSTATAASPWKRTVEPAKSIPKPATGTEHLVSLGSGNDSLNEEVQICVTWNLNWSTLCQKKKPHQHHHSLKPVLQERISPKLQMCLKAQPSARTATSTAVLTFWSQMKFMLLNQTRLAAKYFCETGQVLSAAVTSSTHKAGGAERQQKDEQNSRPCWICASHTANTFSLPDPIGLLIVS